MIKKLVFSLFLVSFAAPALVPSAEALSIEDERLLGKEFLARITRSFQFLENDTAVSYLRDLGAYLATAEENKPFDLNFYILQNSELNAFAAPGGHIFVHTGLILSLETVDELAAVLTHEIAHVTARHISQRIAQQQKLTLASAAALLAGVFIGGEASEAIITGSVAASAQAQLHYSRNDERQADQIGFDYMEKTAFHPDAMLSVLDKITRSQWESTSQKMPTYLRTHPAGPERMSNLDVLMARKSKPISRVQAEKFRRFFPSFQTAVAAASLSPSAAEKTFRKRFSKARSPEEKCLAHLGLGMALSSRAKYDEAVANFKSALSLDPHMLPALLELGNTYRMAGRPRQAVSILEEAMERDENNRVALYLAGLSYQQMEEYEKSVKYFERLASIGTQKHEVFYQLGISYGRLEKLAKAHYNFAKYFAALLQNEDAAFHFRKAEEFAKGNPALLHRIQREMNRQGFRTK